MHFAKPDPVFLFSKLLSNRNTSQPLELLNVRRRLKTCGIKKLEFGWAITHETLLRRHLTHGCIGVFCQRNAVPEHVGTLASLRIPFRLELVAGDKTCQVFFGNARKPPPIRLTCYRQRLSTGTFWKLH